MVQKLDTGMAVRYVVTLALMFVSPVIIMFGIMTFPSQEFGIAAFVLGGGCLGFALLVRAGIAAPVLALLALGIAVTVAMSFQIGIGIGG